MEEANALIDEVLNEQTHLLWEWRTRLISLLTQSLSAESNGSNNADGNESNNADGNEYSRTLETQGEAETFLQAYSALLADRREGIGCYLKSLLFMMLTVFYSFASRAHVVGGSRHAGQEQAQD